MNSFVRCWTGKSYMSALMTQPEILAKAKALGLLTSPRNRAACQAMFEENATYIPLESLEHDNFMQVFRIGAELAFK